MSDAPGNQHVPNLLPCPFCGGPGEVDGYYGNYTRPMDYCGACRACDFSLDGDSTPEKARDRWNRRADLVPAQPSQAQPGPVMSAQQGQNMTEHERLFTILRAHMPDRHAEDAVNELIAVGWTERASYAKGLEDAARRYVDATIAEEEAAVRGGLFANLVRALSPLPPGSRVVVVPAEGSEEWEHAMERGMDYSRRAVSRGFTSEQHLKLRLTYALAAALRALTGGES